jgi:predicted transcriptional regulator
MRVWSQFAVVAAFDAAHDEETVPSALANRIFAGENPLRVWRQHRGLGQAELARRCELSQSYLSQLEVGRRIARVLGITLDDLAPAAD